VNPIDAPPKPGAPARPRAATFPSRLVHAHAVAEGTFAFHIARPPGFAFAAGQSINLMLVDPAESDARGSSRALTIASAPSEPSLMVVTRMRDTAFKRVLGRLAPGAPVSLRGPSGRFTLPEGDRAVVLVAGGIGITPFLSMLRQEAHAGSRRPTLLLYSNRRPADAAFLAELQAMAQRAPALRMVATMTGLEGTEPAWQGERGKLGPELLARHAARLGNPLWYLAGPTGMVAALGPAIAALGVPREDIRVDGFSGY
jgi:ferredoxin-NADP reductase